MQSTTALALATDPEAKPASDPALETHADAAAGFVRRAYDLTRDLMRPDARLYWLDLGLTSLATYGALAIAWSGAPASERALAALVCAFALYRALSFIHELTHLRPGETPGFNTGWNVLIGTPFLTPSFLYEGVHILHHAKDRYGTARDPEYLQLARYPADRILGFVIVAALAPIGVLLRFAIAAPLSFAFPAIRRVVVGRLSAMSINPTFEREVPEDGWPRAWLAQEIACWLWSWTLLALVATGILSLEKFLIAAGVFSIATLVNQARTLGAHRWESAGDRMTFVEQYRDTVNIAPPARLPGLWAPVGLRYHALHHLLPRIPYHNLAEAHRRLARAFPPAADYHAASQASLTETLQRLLAKSAAYRALRGEP